MCEPTTLALASLAIGTASAGAGLLGQQQSAEAQTAYYNQNAANARVAFSNTNAALNERTEQQQDVDAQQRQEDSLKTQSAQATAVAAGAAGGVSGLSLEGILGDYGAKNARADAAINTQEGWDSSQVQLEKTGAADQQVSNTDSVRPGVFNALNFADAGLRIAGSGIGAANQYNTSRYYGMGGNPLSIGGFH